MLLDSTKLPDDLSLNALKILTILFDFDENGDGLNVTDIAVRSGMHNVSSSEYLHKMEIRGLVERFAHPRDRRQSLFRLTKKGRALVASWQPDAALQRHHATPALSA